MNFALKAEKDGIVTILAVSGEVDIQTSPYLRARIQELIAPDEHLIVDLERVDFLDSTGLGVLVGGLNRTKQAGGSMSLVCDRVRVLKPFQVTGLTTLFAIYSTRDDAIAAQRTGPATPR